MADTWFALVDAARDPAIHGLVQRCAQQQCLVTGEVDPVVAAVLPYLVRLDDGEPLMAAWQARGSGQSWGIMFQSALKLDALRVHFKKFLYAQLPSGQVAMFRFYDPRVFRTFLAAATRDEQAPWFQGVDRFWVESETPGKFHDFCLYDGTLYDMAAA